ncbi:MAG TPA: glycosyltransferase [Blastocatellia bacterium]|nr:glycosyltransferase [Blastocatellia bacterium]
MQNNHPENSKPLAPRLPVSLVVPLRNEAESLESLIESIRRQTFAPEEIILVDGGSTDKTVELARELSRGDGRFRVIETGEATPGRGRNIGAAAARNEWIALTDAGIRLEPTWLERLVEVVGRDPEVRVVYGSLEPVVDSFFMRCAALAYVSPKHKSPSGRIRGPFIASSLMRREVWQEAGGFPDLRAAEDLIFMERVRERGFRTGWAPSAVVWWQLRPTLRSTFQKFVLYSKHNVWAGRQWDWHYGVARAYLLALPFLLLALAHNIWWLTVPASIALARVAKNILRRREGENLFRLLNPAQFAGVAVVLGAIDLATFFGWAQAILYKDGRPRQANRAGSSELTG